MNLYGLLDAIIGKVNRSVKVDEQELGETLQKQARDNINAVGKEEVCNPNLLDNWYFLNPVNQKGQTEYNILGYTIDRWTAAYGDISVSLESDGLQLVYNGSNALIEQYLEEDLTGKTVCFSVLTDMGVFSATKVVDDLGYISPGVIPNIGQLEIFVSGGRTIFRIWLKTEGASLKLIAAKLELGDTQTLAHQDSGGNWILNEIPKYSEELLKCRQYDLYTGEYIGLRKFGQPRNLLNNSDFTNPVNQQRQTSYTAANNNVRAVDRWEALQGTVTINSGYVNFTSGQTANHKRFVQLVDTKFEAGKTYTLALLARVNSVSGRAVLRLAKRYAGSGGTQIKNTTTGFEWIMYTYTLTEDIEIPGFDILVSNTASDYLNIDIKAAAIYEGSYTVETLPEYQPKKYEEELLICRQYDPNTGAYIGLRKFSQPRNLLDNSDFTNPVNQRGATSYTGYAYSIDRWRIGGNASASLQVITNKKVIFTNTEDNWSSLEQDINNPLQWVGKTLTLACLGQTLTGSVQISLFTGSNTMISSVNLPFEKDICLANLAVPATLENNRLWVRIMPSGVASSCDLYWIALYEGSYTAETLPEYQPKGYGAELAECMRYFQKHAIHVPPNFASTEYRYYSHGFYMPMRIIPSITILDCVEYKLWTKLNAVFSFSMASQYFVRIQSAVNATPNQDMWAYLTFEASADL